MRYGPIVAKRYKNEYFKRGIWFEFKYCNLQPEQIYIILKELKTKEAIEVLVHNRWTRRLPKKKRVK